MESTRTHKRRLHFSPMGF